jgi:hypothetical protein
MQGRAGFEQMRPLARIDHDHAFGMVDHPRIRREPSGPLAVPEHRKPSSQSASVPFDLCALDPDGAGLDGMELHAFTTIERTIAGWSKCTMWPAFGTSRTVVAGAAIAAGKSLTTAAGVSASRSPKT